MARSESDSDGHGDDRAGQYCLVPVVQTPRLDPGEKIEIDLYFLGGGRISDNRLDIIYGFGNLVNRDNLGEAQSAVAIDLDGNIRTGQDSIEDELIKTSYNLPTTGRRFSFADQLINSQHEDSTTDFPTSALGRSHDGSPPLKLRIQTTSDADPGDYKLPLVFTYDSDGDIRQDRHRVKVHINSWVERHKRASMIAVITSAVIALLSLVVSAGFFSWLFSML